MPSTNTTPKLLPAPAYDFRSRRLTRSYLVGLFHPRLQTGLSRRFHSRFRPHSYLGGATPEEKYPGQTPANTLPRFEPRASAKPRVELRGKPGQRVQFDIDFAGDNPISETSIDFMPIFRAGESGRNLKSPCDGLTKSGSIAREWTSTPLRC